MHYILSNPIIMQFVKQSFSQLPLHYRTIFLGVLASLLLVSCQPDQHALLETDTLQPEEQEILHYLSENGYHTDAVEFLEDFVVYEDDAGWDKAALLQTIRGGYAPIVPIDPDDPTLVPLHGRERQRGVRESNYLDAVNQVRIKNLRYFINNTLFNHCGQDWVAVYHDAAHEWNDIPHCQVKLTPTIVRSHANIIIGSDSDSSFPAGHQDLSSGLIARAGFPSNGVPWKWISVNDSADSWNSKLKTAMHEFGHCLGYRHTGTSDGQHIHGTDHVDSESIMNTGVNTTPAFPVGDVRAARLYYPERLITPTGISVTKIGDGMVRFRYRNMSHISRPYYWVRVYKYTPGGMLLDYRDFQSITSSGGTHAIYWPGHGSGEFRFSARAYNFRRDIYSSATSKYLVNL